MRTWVLATLSFGLLAAAQPASAVVAFVDNFSITKNGNLFFNDAFTDGLQPPNAPNYPNGVSASYFVNGTLPPNSETLGKLRINSVDGATVVNASGTSNSSLSATLLSNIDPNNLVNGLKIDDTFSMTAVFDLVTNGGPLFSGYGIGFNDSGNGLGRRNEMNLQVMYSTGLGVEIIRLHYQDFDNGTLTTVALTPVSAPIGADQIRLTLTRGDVNTSDLVGSFQYLDNGSPLGLETTLGTTSIFQDRNYVRGFFYAASNQRVPEPGTLALLGLGLAGLAATRRRKQ